MTLVHKGNIMKFTEGAFGDWGCKTAVNEFQAIPLMVDLGISLKIQIQKNIIIKDVIATQCFSKY